MIDIGANMALKEEFQNITLNAYQHINRRDLERLVRRIDIEFNKLANSSSQLSRLSLSNLVDTAENQRVVSRDGMKKSGIGFVRFEQKYRKDELVVDQDATEVLKHLKKQSLRAINILNNPNGYKPKGSANRLYGGSGLHFYVKFNPILP
jgi:hypothetical protein